MNKLTELTNDTQIPREKVIEIKDKLRLINQTLVYIIVIIVGLGSLAGYLGHLIMVYPIRS